MKSFSLGTLVYLCMSHALFATTPAEIYQQRVIPLLQSSGASSCSECHLQGINLYDFLSENPKQSFASLRSKGWIDVDHPADSKILEFIAKKSESTDEVIEKVRAAELAAITAWVTAAVKDPESLNVPIPVLDDLKVDRELVLHTRKDHITNRFVDAIWSQLERCANCHSPDRNAKQVEKHGESMSWIVPQSPQATLQLLENRKLIDLDNPSASLLRTKPTAIEKHGAGIKFPVDGQTDREWISFFEDYAKVRRNVYAKASELPKANPIKTWRTPLHLRVTDIPSDLADQYVVIFFHRKQSDGSFDPSPIAFGESRISKERMAWGNSLLRIEPISEDNAEPLNGTRLLPQGTYQARWVVVKNPSQSLKELVLLRPTAVREIIAPWKSGHSEANSVSFKSFVNPE